MNLRVTTSDGVKSNFVSGKEFGEVEVSTIISQDFYAAIKSWYDAVNDASDEEYQRIVSKYW